MYLKRASRLLAIVATCVLLLCAATRAAPPTKEDIPSDLPTDLKQLIEQTFSDNLSERAEAAQKLGEMHERATPAIPFLIRLTDHLGVGKSSSDAAKALVKIGDPALDACIAATNAPPKQLSKGVIHALGMFNSERSVDRLLELLKSSEPKIRESALIALIGTTDPRATMPLVNLLEDEKGYTSDFAAQCFQSIRDDRAVAPLLKSLKTSSLSFLSNPFGSDRERRLDLIRALGFQRAHRAVPDLVNILENPKEPDVLRAEAAEALGKIGAPGPINSLVNILQDRTVTSRLRAGAARGIGAYHPQLTIAETGQMDEVRDDARLLFLLGNVLLADDEQRSLQIAAAQAMGEFGNPKATKALTKTLNDHEHDDLGF